MTYDKGVMSVASSELVGVGGGRVRPVVPVTAQADRSRWAGNPGQAEIFVDIARRAAGSFLDEFKRNAISEELDDRRDHWDYWHINLALGPL